MPIGTAVSASRMTVPAAVCMVLYFYPATCGDERADTSNSSAYRKEGVVHLLRLIVPPRFAFNGSVVG